MKLFGHAAQVALWCRCLNQADALVKEAVAAAAEVARDIGAGALRPRTSLEARLSEAVRSLLNVLLLAPDRKGDLELLGQLIEACKDGFSRESDRRMAVLVEALNALAVAKRNRLPFGIGTSWGREDEQDNCILQYFPFSFPEGLDTNDILHYGNSARDARLLDLSEATSEEVYLSLVSLKAQGSVPESALHSLQLRFQSALQTLCRQWEDDKTRKFSRFLNQVKNLRNMDQ